MKSDLNFHQVFLDRHSEYFARVLNSAKDAFRKTFMGAGNTCSYKDFFEALLVNDDYDLLPFGLLYIYFGVGVLEDEAFAVSGLKDLWEAKGNDLLAGYIYAFCLNELKRDDECMAVLEKLLERDYLPAVASYADLQVANENYDEAFKLYQYLHSKNYWPTGTYYLALKYKKSNKALSILKPVESIIFKARFLYNVLKTSGRGEKVTYLNIFSIEFDKHGNQITVWPDAEI